MGPLEPEAEYDPPVGFARATRALTLIFMSVVVIAAIGIAYVRPSFGATPAPVTRAVPAAYQLSGVDFVSATTGWFVGGSPGR